MAAKKSPESARRSEGRFFSREDATHAIRAFAALANFAERCGVAFAVLVVLLFTIWLMGSTETRDDFIRELLFGSITNTRYLSLFVAVLIVIAVLGGLTARRAKVTESDEMKRLADERTAWQERALGRTLSHTAEEHDT